MTKIPINSPKQSVTMVGHPGASKNANKTYRELLKLFLPQSITLKGHVAAGDLKVSDKVDWHQFAGLSSTATLQKLFHDYENIHLFFAVGTQDLDNYAVLVTLTGPQFGAGYQSRCLGNSIDEVMRYFWAECMREQTAAMIRVLDGK